MEKISLKKSEDYLKKINQTSRGESDPAVEESEKRLATPIAEVQYGQDDSVEISGKDYDLKFQYSPVDDESWSDVEEYMNGLREKLRGYLDELWDTGSWRQVSGLRAKPKNAESEVDLLKAIPEGYQLFFCPTDVLHYGSILHEQKKIYIIGNLASPISLVILLHEAGHGWDVQELEDPGSSKLTDDHEFALQAEKIRRERAASAFALKTLRPFLSKEQRADAINYLKHIALKSYNDKAREMIEGPKTNTMVHYGQDYEYSEQEQHEQWMWDEWMNFKKSDEYADWKQMKEFESLDEDEEYGAWRDWAEKKWAKEAESSPEN